MRIGVESCNHTGGGSISLPTPGALHVIIDIYHSRTPSWYAIGWAGFVAWAASRAIAVRFKAPFHFGWIPVVEDNLRRHRQAERTFKTCCLAHFPLQSEMSLHTVLLLS